MPVSAFSVLSNARFLCSRSQRFLISDTEDEVSHNCGHLHSLACRVLGLFPVQESLVFVILLIQPQLDLRLESQLPDRQLSWLESLDTALRPGQGQMSRFHVAPQRSDHFRQSHVEILFASVDHIDSPVVELAMQSSFQRRCIRRVNHSVNVEWKRYAGIA